ncbi:uncharacterized protein LOC131257705 [Magnolia sinica]|uniref:uncharacterized protein LOC131257705 n=1 Tax=Magnolia sinica TaxID=86752 RepID=UPI00265B4E30|nr:uncharacterized protein LOC131257705 [Magnolia sinica]
MLSIEIPPSDPPCSISELNGGDEPHHQSHFSIRDYVFTSRSNDIEANWPFPQQFLHLCLKHGVENILPPFEPPNLVRAAQCRRKGVGNQLIIHVGVEKALPEVDSFGSEDLKLNETKYDDCGPSDQSAFISSNQDQSFLLEEGNLIPHQADEKPCGLSRSSGSSEVGGEGETASEASVEVLNPPHSSKKIDTFCEPSDKKRRLIVRLGPISRPGRTEEIVPNSSAVTEPMASKVCPVCKTFSSTSNTTLNAHIDQCLAMESTMKGVMTKLTEQKVKPRKKRLLVDIYKTAPSCTLEELDRRNGSNWATDLSLTTPNDEARAESKRQRKAQVNFMDDDDENPVYFDSNGTKLRILSKFDSGSASTAVESCEPRKLVKEDDTNNKNFSIRKKKRLASKCSKHLSLSKRTCTIKLSKGEIHGAPDWKNNHKEKEELLSQLLKVRPPIKSSSSGTLKQWVCSKRTNLPKKLNDRDPVPVLEDLSIERNQSVSSNPSAERSLVLKLKRLPENSMASQRSKRVETLSNVDGLADNGNKSPELPKHSFNPSTKGTSSKAGCALKFAGALGNQVSSPRSKRVEINTTAVRMSTKSSGGHDTILRKAGEISTWRKSALFGKPSVPTEASVCNEKRKLPSFKRTLKVNRTHKWGRSKNLTRSDTKQIVDEVSRERTDELECGLDREALDKSERRETINSRGLNVEAECRGHDLDSMDSQAGGTFHQNPSNDVFQFKSNGQEFVAKEATASGDTGIKYSGGKAIRDLVLRTSETRSSEDHVPAAYSDIHPNLSPSLEESVGPTFASYADQELQCSDCIPIRGSGACLASPGEMGFQLQEDSSITSNGPPSEQDQHKPADRDLQSSPISAGSTVSAPVTERSEFEYFKQEPMVGSATVEGNMISSFQGNGNESALADANDVELGAGAERTQIDVEKLEVMILSEKEHTSLSEDRLCCCMRKESASHGPAMTHQDPQLWRQKSVTATAMTLSNEGKQMASDWESKPVEFCTSSSGLSLRSDEMVISVKASSISAVENQNFSDNGPASPSSQTHPRQPMHSHPILRLMGKNLMVGNKDEDDSVRPKATLNDHSSAKCPIPTFLGFSSGNVSNQSSNGSVTIESSHPSPDFDVGFSRSFRDHGNLKVHQLPGDHQAMHAGGSALSALQTQLNKLNEKPNFPFAHNVERIAQKPVSSTQAAEPTREVIFIDDSSDPESDLSTNDHKYTPGLRNLLPLMGISTPAIMNHNTREPMSFLMSCPGANVSYAKRGGTSEGAGVHPDSPFILPHCRQVT